MARTHDTHRGVRISRSLDAAFCAAAAAEGVSPSAALRRSMEFYVAAVAEPRSDDAGLDPGGVETPTNGASERVAT